MTRPCPICGKPAGDRARPFCSPRCADIDLGRWLTAQYVVPGPPGEEMASEGIASGGMAGGGMAGEPAEDGALDHLEPLG